MFGSKLTSQPRSASSAMPYQTICRWLGLQAESWPPDHYALLGLNRGESDLNRIEASAEVQLRRVRCYQLSHPELATEAMNRLAQAYACLTDPTAKGEYDTGLGIVSQPLTRPPGDNGQNLQSFHDTVTGKSSTVLEVDPAPPPAQQTQPAETASAALASDATDGPPPAPIQEQSAPAPPPAPAAAPRACQLARGRLGTRKALYHRVVLTRELSASWRRVGKYLKQPKKKLTQQGEDKDLQRGLSKIDELLFEFPGFLGRPGKAGYRVAMLAQDERPLQAFQKMNFNERQALALDWVAGYQELSRHQDFLRHEYKRRRREGWVPRLLRPGLACLEDHQRSVLLTLLAVLVVGTAAGLLYLFLVWQSL
jgi:hypothetical protein